jgi:hypothetical protein
MTGQVQRCEGSDSSESTASIIAKLSEQLADYAVVAFAVVAFAKTLKSHHCCTSACTGRSAHFTNYRRVKKIFWFCE